MLFLIPQDIIQYGVFCYLNLVTTCDVKLLFFLKILPGTKCSLQVFERIFVPPKSKKCLISSLVPVLSPLEIN